MHAHPLALTCWLPALQRFDPAHPLRLLLRRADRLPDSAQGYLGGLASYFECGGDAVPAAALVRDYLAGDAEGFSWLAADPAWVQPDLTGARLMACGHMQLSMDDAQGLAEPLRPIFAEEGMSLDIASPDRWQLRLPLQSTFPDFAAPEQALGADLYEHLPEGAHGRRWRVLLNEVQVLLHQHPVNVTRRQHGLPPINSLWFWGGGSLPPRVTAHVNGVLGEDVLLLALARRAGIPAQSRESAWADTVQRGWLIDLQDQTSDEIASRWWTSLQALSRQHAVLYAFASGERWLHHPWHRLRFWRRNSG